jgi:hypothetical protein
MKIDKNFTILSEYALEQGELHYDIHNNYDFAEFKRDVYKNTIDLVFLKTNEDWVREEDPKSITLRFYEPSFFKSSENLFLMQNSYIPRFGYITQEYMEADFLFDEKDIESDSEKVDFYIYFDICSNSSLPDSYLIIRAPKIRLIT